jgi:hypothetical protein
MTVGGHRRPTQVSEISTPTAMTATIATMPIGSSSIALNRDLADGKVAGDLVGRPGSVDGPPPVVDAASATVSGVWQCGQTVSPLMCHVQQLRQTARLTDGPQRTQRHARRKDCKRTARQKPGGLHI